MIFTISSTTIIIDESLAQISTARALPSPQKTGQLWGRKCVRNICASSMCVTYPSKLSRSACSEHRLNHGLSMFIYRTQLFQCQIGIVGNHVLKPKGVEIPEKIYVFHDPAFSNLVLSTI